MNKVVLREKMINELKIITSEEKGRIENNLIEILINSDIWKQANVIGLTLAQDFEWDTRKLIEIAWKQRKKVVLPKCLPKVKQLEFYVVHDFSQLENVYMHLLEPKITETKRIYKNDIDLLIVPGLIFDKNGFRIGFGGGYYDRFLVDFKNKKMSLCSNRQILSTLPIDSFDIPVDYLATETEIIDINQSKSNL